MGRGTDAPERRMNAGQLIDSIYPNSKAKRLQAGMGVSWRQARRIVTTGRVPSKLWPLFLKAVAEQNASNAAKMEALRLEIKAIEHAEMVARAEARRASNVGQDSEIHSGPRERAKDASLN